MYPFILWVFARNKKPPFEQYVKSEDLPTVSVIMAAHNEELVIERKIKSLLNTTYPIDKIEVLIGSDCSTDATNEIVDKAASVHSNIRFFKYTNRQGKVGVMNQLVDIAKGEIIISTDANVFLSPHTLFHLVKYFACKRIGLVDTRMTNSGLKPEGISTQESAYITHEAVVKYREGLLWGGMIGPFGGCYAIRKECYCKPPLNSLVDDFYINMKVLEQGMNTINSKNAVVVEDVSNSLKEEFRRKVRISTGNFQNLGRFAHMLWPPYKPIAFAFLSHKVIRWLGPILIMLSFASSAILAKQHTFFFVAFVAHVIVLLLPLVDQLFKLLKINIQVLRFITHFLSMNIALFVGLLKYFKGVKSNVWQPTQRNQ